MGSLAATLLRVLIVLWVMEALNEATFPDHEVRTLQKRIKLFRKWNERLGRYIMKLETEYAELVL